MSIGVVDDATIVALGWEEVCRRWVLAYPVRLNLNAFYGVIAAAEGIDWRELSDAQRAEARALKRQIGDELGVAVEKVPAWPGRRRR